MTIQPDEEISFNKVIGDTTPEKGYQKAKIILNGQYVDDFGGGVCQASTTLYNALILSDIEIQEVNPHSLPVSYVPLAFDAMVSDGYSDLKFKNNLDYPIYIKAWGDDEKAYVNIYGSPLEEGEEIRRKAEFIEIIPHQGDIIIKDEKREYSDKITYAGEYLRIKYPQEGYRSKAYICYYKDEKLIEQKLIRDEVYKPQKGIVIEGVETLGEGMIIPENEVKIIPPQISAKTNNNSINKKITEQNPSEYNP
jgi:vancomycin resistance protein YoaR